MSQSNRKGKARRGELALLGQAALLEEGGVPGLVRGSLLVGTVVLGLAVAWAAYAKVDEVSVAVGEVLPSGSIRVVQHLEGGIVDAIMVADGSLVEQGQVLVRLAPAEPEADRAQMRAREASLLLTAARIRAFIGEEPVALASVAPGFPDLAANEQVMLDAATKARDEQRRVLELAVAQAESEVAILQRQRETAVAQLAIVTEELGMRETLMKAQLQSKIVYLETERERSRIQGEIAALDARVYQARGAIAEAEGRRVELDAKLADEAVDALGRVTAELAEVRANLARLEDRVARLDVVAPVRGIVKGLAITTVGGVVRPGEPIMEIVPVDDTLVAEARLSTRDVGHVGAGYPAAIKVTAYDFARYGSVPGEVIDVSASTFQGEDGVPYYKAIVALAADHVGTEAGRNMILPGMTVQVDINTGTRTVLDYLLKPVEATLEQALRER